MKKMSLAIALVSMMGTSNAFAFASSDCSGNSILAWGMILTITSAPTGTTIGIAACDRDVVLNLKEEAMQYQLTGEASTILKEAVAAGKKAQPNLSEEAIIEKFLAVKVQ